MPPLALKVADKFERSTDTGASNEFGEAQKLMSTGRTSENAWYEALGQRARVPRAASVLSGGTLAVVVIICGVWCLRCINDCYTHPEVVKLTSRLEHITKIPSANYENFQVTLIADRLQIDNVN